MSNKECESIIYRSRFSIKYKTYCSFNTLCLNKANYSLILDVMIYIIKEIFLHWETLMKTKMKHCSRKEKRITIATLKSWTPMVSHIRGYIMLHISVKNKCSPFSYGMLRIQSYLQEWVKTRRRPLVPLTVVPEWYFTHRQDGPYHAWQVSIAMMLDTASKTVEWA